MSERQALSEFSIRQELIESLVALHEQLKSASRRLNVLIPVVAYARLLATTTSAERVAVIYDGVYGRDKTREMLRALQSLVSAVAKQLELTQAQQEEASIADFADALAALLLPDSLAGSDRRQQLFPDYDSSTGRNVLNVVSQTKCETVSLRALQTAMIREVTETERMLKRAASDIDRAVPVLAEAQRLAALDSPHQLASVVHAIAFDDDGLRALWKKLKTATVTLEKRSITLRARNNGASEGDITSVLAEMFIPGLAYSDRLLIAEVFPALAQEEELDEADNAAAR